MSMLYLAGRLMNAMGRGPGGGDLWYESSNQIASSPAAEGVAPADNACDGNPSTPVIAGSVSTDGYIRVDLNLLSDPDFENAALASWTDTDGGTGTSVSTTTNTKNGGRAIAVTGSSSASGVNYGSRTQSVLVRAGESLKANVYCNPKPTGAAAGTGKLFIRNLKTGKYWSGSAWTSTRTACDTTVSTSDSWSVTLTATFSIESFDICLEDTVSLSFECVSENGLVHFDQAYLVPGVNFASVHGHNIGPRITPKVQTSDDLGTWLTRSTMPVKRPAFYSVFTTRYQQFWQFLFEGTPHAPYYIGECVLGQYQTSAAQPLWSPVVSREFPGFRQNGTSGVATAYNTATDPTESIGMDFLAVSATAEKDLYDNLWLRSGQGLHPAIIVPRDDEAAVYYGHLMDPYKHSRPFGDARPTDLFLKGAPFPSVGL